MTFFKSLGIVVLFKRLGIVMLLFKRLDIVMIEGTLVIVRSRLQSTNLTPALPLGE